MDEFKIPEGMLEQCDIDNVAACIEGKIEFIRATEPYARKTIADLEIALHEVLELTYDLD